MKSMKDLLALIASEDIMNEDKIVQYTFSIDTRYNWASMWQTTPSNKTDKNGQPQPKHEELFHHLPINNAAEIQLVYWSIWNKGRSRFAE